MRNWRMGMRHVSEPRDVVVLTAGGNRGAIQAGMLQVLLERGIRPMGYVGSSVGALNAAFMAYDSTPERASELGERWDELRTEDIFPGGPLTRLGNVVRRRAFLHSPDGLRTLINAWVPVERVEDLPTPLRVVTTRLDTGAEVAHERGQLLPVLLASAALPAMFPPVSLPERGDAGTALHVDGGVSALVPVGAARTLQPTRVFILDATVPVRMRQMRSPVEALVASLGAATRAHVPLDLGDGITVHRISCTDLGAPLTDFSRTPEHLALGRRAAHRLLDDLAIQAA